MAGWRLPSPADARHVRVELMGEAAAGSPLQERGADGRLEQLPPVLVEFCEGPESTEEAGGEESTEGRRKKKERKKGRG